MTVTRLVAEYDVVVVGGGSAGMAAAVGAARTGARTALLERNGFSGGMATAAEVGTICGLYYRSSSGPRFVDDGFPREFAERIIRLSDTAPRPFAQGLWFLPYGPLQFKVLCDQLLEQHGVSVYYHCCITSAESTGGKVREISGLLWNSPCTFNASAFVDTSGEATLTALTGAALLEETARQAGAIIFELRDTGFDDETLLGRTLYMEVARGVTDGLLPEGCRGVSVVPGSVSGGSAAIKLSLPDLLDEPDAHLGRIEMRARDHICRIADYLTQRSDALRSSRVLHCASQVGVRTGRRPKGNHVLTENEVAECRVSPGEAARGVWPIEEWGLSRAPNLLYLPEERHYSIPAGCLVSESTANLFFAGRNLSASDRALASARVIGTCLATGYAAGAAAARHCAAEVSPSSRAAGL